jgi:hypothetical protein
MNETGDPRDPYAEIKITQRMAHSTLLMMAVLGFSIIIVVFTGAGWQIACGAVYGFAWVVLASRYRRLRQRIASMERSVDSTDGPGTGRTA